MKKIVCIITLWMVAAIYTQAANKPESKINHRVSYKGTKCRISQKCRERGEHRVHGEGIPIMLTILNNSEVANELGLDKEQSKAIRKKLNDYEKKRKKLKRKMEEAALKQAKLMTAKKLDEPALMNVIEQMGDYRTEISKERIKLIIFMRRTLSPEQIRSVHKIMRAKMEKRRSINRRLQQKSPQRGSRHNFRRREQKVAPLF